MSMHINRFIDKIKAAESKRQPNLMLSISEARDLHGDITKLLLALQEIQTRATETKSSPASVDLQVDGGTF